MYVYTTRVVCVYLNCIFQMGICESIYTQKIHSLLSYLKIQKEKKIPRILTPFPYYIQKKMFYIDIVERGKGKKYKMWAGFGYKCLKYFLIFPCFLLVLCVYIYLYISGINR